MLINYAFSNFQSFRERTKVDLALSQKVTLTDWMWALPDGERVSKIMAVIGPNGSGKTALLKPLAFLGWFISQSFQNPPNAPIPITPHQANSQEPLEMEALVHFDQKLWRYVVRCTPERVLHEALYQKRDRFSYVFIRDWDETANVYTVKQQDFGLPAQEARKVRPNVSLINWAAQYDVPLAKRMAATVVITNVNVLGREHMNHQLLVAATHHFSANDVQCRQMESLLTRWDLGLSGVVFKDVPVSDLQMSGQSVLLPFGKHVSHQKEFTLPFTLESSGTQGAYVLLSRLFPALQSGGLAVIDEFECDLHPHMIEPILDLFANPKSNPHQAQLLFTCHAVEVLNLVHKSQVMLVEKNDDCESSACRLDRIGGIRNDDNHYAKYMAGAYGAVPNF